MLKFNIFKNFKFYYINLRLNYKNYNKVGITIVLFKKKIKIKNKSNNKIKIFNIKIMIIS